MKAMAGFWRIIRVSLALMSAAPAIADLPLVKQTCSISASITPCPQIDPKKGTIVSIGIDYSATNKFAFSVTGDSYTKTDYKVTVWEELDTQGGDIGSFYMTETGIIAVTPNDAPPSQPTEIMVAGSHSGTETDPVKLGRFVGTSTVPIQPIAEPATGAGNLPVVGTGTIQSFYLLSSNVSGTLTLNYRPILLKPPVIKLPPQKLPKPPFKVPPYPKPKS